jgi:hypothetical protein
VVFQSINSLVVHTKVNYLLPTLWVPVKSSRSPGPYVNGAITL